MLPLNSLDLGLGALRERRRWVVATEGKDHLRQIFGWQWVLGLKLTPYLGFVVLVLFEKALGDEGHRRRVRSPVVLVQTIARFGNRTVPELAPAFAFTLQNLARTALVVEPKNIVAVHRHLPITFPLKLLNGHGELRLGVDVLRGQQLAHVARLCPLVGGEAVPERLCRLFIAAQFQDVQFTNEVIRHKRLQQAETDLLTTLLLDEVFDRRA